MTAVNPPPQDAPDVLKRNTIGFWDRLLKTVYLLWFNDKSRANQIELTGTTSAIGGGSVTVAHGIDSQRIKGFTGAVISSSGEGVDISAHCTVSFDATNITVTNSGTAPASVLNKTFFVFVSYK